MRKSLRPLALATLSLLLAACGGGDGGNGSTTGSTTPATVAVSGTVTGLPAGLSVNLLNNGGDSLTLTQNGAFTFATPVAAGASYSVTVGTQPWWQYCTVTNGSGAATGSAANVQIACAPAQAQVSTLAGSGTSGSADGVGTAASFNDPQGIAVDASGNVYVADSSNNKIRKISPAGVVTTWAGVGTAGAADGSGATASFYLPFGIAVDAGGNAYVADSGNNKIRKISPAGMVTTLAGSGTETSVDGTGSAASFNNPLAIALDASDNVYVTENNPSKIRKITPGGIVTTVVPSSTGSATAFWELNGIALDKGNNIWLTDVQVFLSPYIEILVDAIAPSGSVFNLIDEPDYVPVPDNSVLNNPSGIVVDPMGNLFVADTGRSAIFKISPTGTITRIAGSGAIATEDGIGTAASFRSPANLALDAAGNIYVSDQLGNNIRKISPVQ
jgi:sugar lactone lactonase YvrE